MKKMKMKYCEPIDNLYIAFSDKRSMVGSEEFQSGVVLYRDSGSKELIGIEIMNFTEFNENPIRISSDEALDILLNKRPQIGV